MRGQIYIEVCELIEVHKREETLPTKLSFRLKPDLRVKAKMEYACAS